MFSVLGEKLWLQRKIHSLLGRWPMNTVHKEINCWGKWHNEETNVHTSVGEERRRLWAQMCGVNIESQNQLTVFRYVFPCWKFRPRVGKASGINFTGGGRRHSGMGVSKFDHCSCIHRYFLFCSLRNFE